MHVTYIPQPSREVYKTTKQPSVMSEPSPSLRYCVHCESFLALDAFMPNGSRTICRAHFYKLKEESKNKRWAKRPILRKAHTVWQHAYIASRKTFQVKLDMSFAFVLELIDRSNKGLRDNVRIIPMDPLQPISKSNFWLTDTKTKIYMCALWRKVRSQKDYMFCMDPRCGHMICASSANPSGD